MSLPIMFKVQPQPEVKVKMSHHSVDQSQATVSPSKELVFVMDVPKEPKASKKDKKGGKAAKDKDVTTKNFGVHVSIPKMKNSENFIVSWRCRLDSQGDGFKTIMPIRPVAILAGNLELDNENINLL